MLTLTIVNKIIMQCLHSLICSLFPLQMSTEAEDTKEKDQDQAGHGDNDEGQTGGILGV